MSETPNPESRSMPAASSAVEQAITAFIEKWESWAPETGAELQTDLTALIAAVRAESCPAVPDPVPAGWTCPTCGLAHRRYYESIIERLKALEAQAVRGVPRLRREDTRGTV